MRLIFLSFLSSAWLTTAACRPPIALTYCATDNDCPASHHCDPDRHFCFPWATSSRPLEKCRSLNIVADHLSQYEGRQVFGQLSDDDGNLLDSFVGGIENETLSITRNYPQPLNSDAGLEILLDADGDARCGVTDRLWQTRLGDVVPDACPLIWRLDWEASLSAERCTRYPPQSDLNGDNCVDEQDIDLMMQSFGLSGDALVGDLDANGLVDHVDLETLLGQYCVGDANCCPGRDAGVPVVDVRMLTGDSNCDGTLGGPTGDQTLGDIDALDLFLDDPDRYLQAFPGCPAGNSDVTCDKVVDEADRLEIRNCVPAQSCGC